MAIIQFIKEYSFPEQTLLNMYPNQYVSQEEKLSDDWIKINMDYFFNVAIQRFTKNRVQYVRNYRLIKGILDRVDYYELPEVKSFTETLLQSEDLPAYVQHYSILTPPLNTLVGEMTKRPDNVYVKAFDDDSKSEELTFKTEVLNQYILSQAKEKLNALLAAQGTEIESPEEFEKMAAEDVQEYMDSYTSTAEKWGARILDFLKVRFNLKEKSEEAFRDMLITAHEYFHIFEDNSPIGFNVEVLNPKNVWYLTIPDEKYISDSLDKNVGAYAAGTIEIMEMSEILQKFELTQEEVDHLRNLSQQAYLLNSRESNLVNGKAPTGSDSVFYNTYDPLVLQYRLQAEVQLNEGQDELRDFLGITNNVGVFGNKYMVVRAYWCSKRKVGKLTFVNDQNIVESVLVDEEYKDGTHPQEISIEWGWVNQWYQGVKIGLDVYYVNPLQILDYCPIIGSVFEIKNTEPKSLVDMMKPFQILYNICMNKLYRLTEKDLGVVFLTSIRHIPTPKDGDPQDALEMWEMEAREKGIVFTDDSPENLKAPSSFNQHNALNLSRANELQAYYNLAVQMRNECWKLVGLSEQRLGESKATETATGINTALTQSYAQTEPYFAHHENLLNRLYQGLLDAAIYIQAHKENDVLSYISNEGENAFVQINGSDLKMRELGVLVTSRAEDAMNFKELRSLAQAMLQNGASPYEIAELYSTKSIRQMKKIFKNLKEQQDQFQQQQMQLEQQKIQQSQDQFAKQQQLLELQHQKDMAFEAYQKEQDRISKEKIAYIQANSKNDTLSGPTELDFSQFEAEQNRASQDYQLKLQDLAQKQQQLLLNQSIAAQNNALQYKKLEAEKYKADMALKVAKENKQNKPKPAKKK